MFAWIRRVLGLHPMRRSTDRYECRADVIKDVRKDFLYRRHDDQKIDLRDAHHPARVVLSQRTETCEARTYPASASTSATTGT